LVDSTHYLISHFIKNRASHLLR